MNGFVQNVDSFVKLKCAVCETRMAKKSPAAWPGWKEGGGLVNYQNEVKPHPFQFDEYRKNILFLGLTPNSDLKILEVVSS